MELGELKRAWHEAVLKHEKEILGLEMDLLSICVRNRANYFTFVQTLYPMRFSIFSIFLIVSTALIAQRPTEAQLRWHEHEFYLFLHFGPNTFTNVEWGHGTEAEDVFQPSALDCKQWCRVAKAAGAKGLIITAKHHDGFCLWPSAFSKHTVRESPWKNGQGDVLQELSEACREEGLLLGFYLSPWDRNHPQYGTPEYNEIYVQTMTELMTQYGDLFEFWWDGANGEGPNGKKQVYDFRRFEKVAAQVQSQAVVFSAIGPGCRWVGNENGLVGETNWCTLDTAGFKRGLGAPSNDTLFHGNYNGAAWIPAECDVSIRPGWFYHPEEDNKVKTKEQLLHIWLNSVGHGANLLLNVPPDRRGLIHPNDSAALVEFAALRKTLFGTNLAKAATVKTGKNRVETLTDALTTTFEAVENQWIQIELPAEQPLKYLQIKEHIANGQSVRQFEVEGWNAATQSYEPWGASTTIGSRKIVALPEGATSSKLRVRVTAAKRWPVELSEISLY